jgi:anti-sigma factor (TIGR02949 family)
MSTELEAVLSCEEIVQLLWDYLDDELDLARREAVRGHLEHCSHCRDHFTFEGAFLRALESVIEEPVDTTAMRTRIVAALRAEGYGGEP